MTWWRRTALCGALLWHSALASAADPSLYVFLPTSIKARSLQTALQTGLPGVEVTVFGRARDFQKTLAETPPDAVLSLSPVLKAERLPVHVQGKRDGSATEAYLVVGPEKYTTAELNQKVVGTIDLMGRGRTEEYVDGLLSIEDASLKRVTEVNDLLALLQFEAADVIFLPESSVAGLLDSSEMELEVTRVESARVGLPAISFITGGVRADLEPRITGVSGDILAKIGISEWEVE